MSETSVTAKPQNPSRTPTPPVVVISKGPSEGELQGSFGFSIGPKVTLKDGEVEASGALSLEGRLGWLVYQSAVIETTGSQLQAGRIFVDINDFAPSGGLITSYSSVSVGLTPEAVVDLQFNPADHNLLLGAYVLYRNETVNLTPNGISRFDWEISLAGGPALAEMASSDDVDTKTGGYVAVDVGTCSGDYCAVVLGGGLTAAIFNDRAVLMATFNSRYLF